MSTYWGLRCKDDGAKSGTGGRNESGREMVRRVAAIAPQCRALLDAVTAADIETDFGMCLHAWWWDDTTSDDPLFYWLAQHAGHALELVNEYGQAEPL